MFYEHGFSGGMLGAPQHSASCFPRTGRDCMRVMPSLAPIWGSLMLNTGTVGFQWDLDLDRSLTFLE